MAPSEPTSEAPSGQRRSGFSKRYFARFIVATVVVNVVVNCSQLSLSINNWDNCGYNFRYGVTEWEATQTRLTLKSSKQSTGP